LILPYFVFWAFSILSFLIIQHTTHAKHENSTGDYLVNTLIGDKITTSGNNIDYEPVKVCVYNNFQTPCDRTDESSKPPNCEELRSLYRGVADYFIR
jgi:hypothetical protein